MKKLIVVFVAMILALQPFVILAATPVNSFWLPTSTSNVMSPAQGSRLEDGEYTNHVPFAIEQTSDFTTQGWPGAGTENDPYIISALKIVADFGLVCISIMNTTAHFVIRDCYLEQGSAMATVHLLNTTHGTIEYTTVNGTERGIHIINANNTLVSHTAVYSGSDNSMWVQYSHHCAVEWSLFDSANSRALRVENADCFTADYCEFYNYNPGWYCTYFSNVNHMVIDNCEMNSDGGAAGIALNSNNFSSISDTKIWAPGAIFGIYIDFCPDITLTGLAIGPTGIGAYISDCSGFLFADSSISETTSHGAVISDSPNSTLSRLNLFNLGSMGAQISQSDTCDIIDCVVDTTSAIGFSVQTSDDLYIDNLTMMHTGDHGLYLWDSDRAKISNSVIADSPNANGFYAVASHNGNFSNNQVNDIGDVGCHIDDGDNWTIAENTVQNTDDIGIFVTGSNAQVCDNEISDIGAEGIYVVPGHDSWIARNDVTNAESTAIVTDGNRVVVEENTIIDCEQGITINYGDNVTIANNIVSCYGFMGGIDIYGSTTPVVQNNQISGTLWGISVQLVENGTFADNTMTDCGFYFEGGQPLSYYNHNVTGSTVNDLPIYYGLHQESQFVSGDNYGQVILANCSDFEVGGGTFDSVTCALELFHCEEIDAHHMISRNNYYGFVITDSDNVTLTELDVSGRTNSFGIYASRADAFALVNSSVSGFSGSTRYGLRVIDSIVVTVDGCYFNSNYRGIYTTATLNITVVDSEFIDIDYEGISVWSSTSMYHLIENNVFLNVSRALYCDRASQWMIRGNLVRHCDITGFYIGGSTADYVNITQNTIESSQDGIYVNNGDYVYIYNNTIRWNTRYGVYTWGSSPHNVFYNTIAFSGTANGYSSTVTYWDDGVSLGNWWDDYSPPGSYYTLGNGEDRYPMQYLPVIPIIDQPQDVTIEELSTGNTITWQPYDDSLRDWEVYINGVFWAADAWNFNDVTVGIDGLAYGTHTVVVTVYDVDQNSVSDTVLVHVIDGTDPVIDAPANTIAFLDATGQTLTWKAYDLNPGTYGVAIDGEVAESGTWTSGTVEYSIDDLELGLHHVVLVVYDLDMNSAGAGVWVEVVDDATSPSIDSPADLEMIEGSIGNNIIWTPEDKYPDRYDVHYNGSVIVSGDWGGSRIVVVVDGLHAGIHVVTLTVYDGTGNSASDEVTVTVIQAAPVTPPPSDDLGLLLMIGAVVGSAAVVIAIVYFLRKRKAS